jgi:methionine aminotransferase
LVHQGDEVIVFDPAYDAYEPAIRLAGGVTVHVPLALSGNEFFVDWQRVKDALTPRTRAVIVNFPHNPTGALLSGDDLDTLASLLESTPILVFSDEVYEHIVFDGVRHLSLTGHDRLRHRSVVISSFGKTFHATGWKLGYVCAPSALTEEFRRVHQFATFAVSTPMQYGLADFMQSNPDYYSKLAEFYAQKRDRFADLLDTTKLTYSRARSTFFQCVDFSAVSDLDDVDMAMHLTQDVGVAAIPLSVFCDDAFTGRRLRLCFAKDDDELERAVDRLATL